jgi:hypothetical protein
MEQFIGCDAHKKFSVFVAVYRSWELQADGVSMGRRRTPEVVHAPVSR